MKISLRAAMVLILALLAGAIPWPPATAAETVLLEYDSAYHHIMVVQDGSIRGLKFDNNYFQSKMDVNNPLAGEFGYVDLLFEAFIFDPSAQDVLIFGLGGGSAQKLLHYHRPDLSIRTVELDPAVVDVAQEYFYYDPVALPVTVSDARSYLRRTEQKYDLIIQDTYSSNNYGTFIPFHLATLEYFTMVRDHLSDDGVFAINVIGTVYGGEPNRVITSVYRTMMEVFPQLYLFAADDVQNVVIVATKDEERLSRTQLTPIARDLVTANPGGFPSDFVQATGRQFYDTAPARLSEAIVLTDDYAPTDNLLR
jgi:spermidine synthase